MSRIWLVFLLWTCVQLSLEAVGTLTWISPYGGDMYGERVIYSLACFAFVIVIWQQQSFLIWLRPGHTEATFAALSACIAALLATPELTRLAYPAVQGWAQAMMFAQLVTWAAMQRNEHERWMAGVIAFMQGIQVIMYVYAQIMIGLTPADAGGPAGALYYLHGPVVDLAPTLIGTALLAWAALRRA